MSPECGGPFIHLLYIISSQGILDIFRGKDGKKYKAENFRSCSDDHPL